ncbi:glycosyltransferase family 2 protein [Saxibacter everestensis]|uniref:Glucosyl-3-phosphoglycerate synthase n=1 Tax=Saxibacter everestensis TaxID=2909229 RepID=A0ABY8QQG1_9MICO|nr:glycosyltransferase family 2 protein [Brevibacteriaceae bacterium ZFBP1038]
MTETKLAVVIPAKDEAERIAATVASAKAIPRTDLVIVVDDGSSDDTGKRAAAAGATVITHPRNRGKAAAMMTGALAVKNRDISTAPGSDDDAAARFRALLFIDADLGETAVNTAPLAAPVTSGHADMTIAILPRQSAAGGGFGFVVGLAAKGIRELSGFEATQPLSGMRCLSREAYEAALPLASGWGVETGLTIDLVTQGFRVQEVECALQHRVTGKNFKAQLHRAMQYKDVWRALAVRRKRARKTRNSQ